MPLFIKIEKFKNKTLEMSKYERKKFLLLHKQWVKDISRSGVDIHSGYLINDKKQPGGGGLLIFEAEDYVKAKNIIKNDPMIKYELVNWDLHEWTSIDGKKPFFQNHLG